MDVIPVCTICQSAQNLEKCDKCLTGLIYFCSLGHKEAHNRLQHDIQIAEDVRPKFTLFRDDSIESPLYPQFQDSSSNFDSSTNCLGATGTLIPSRSLCVPRNPLSQGNRHSINFQPKEEPAHLLTYRHETPVQQDFNQPCFTNVADPEQILERLKLYGVCCVTNFASEEHANGALKEVMTLLESNKLGPGQVSGSAEQVRGDLMTWISRSDKCCPNLLAVFDKVDEIVREFNGSLQQTQIKGRTRVSDFTRRTISGLI